MKNQLLCLLLALLFAVGLAACGDAAPASDGTAATPEGNQQAEPDDAASSAQDSAEPEPPQPSPEEERLAAATHYVNNLPLEQQVAQMFFVRCPETDAAALAGEYNIGGYILFGRDFEGQTRESVTAAIASYQQAAGTPMLIGVDEEGGTVVRVSSNPAFRAAKFRSPQALYSEGGMELIVSDAREKDELLHSLGINVNLAPVCDVSTNPSDFINARAFGGDAAATSEYAAAVVSQMTQDSMGAVLKHFPGYGSNVDTHTGIAIDERPIETFCGSDFLPFQAGFNAGAGSVLVCHNIVTCMDDTLPASLSPAVHRILRNELDFNGVVMTDDLIMQAITSYTDGQDAAVLAVTAGNDMLISSDFATQYNAVLDAVSSGVISPDRIRESAIRVINWKMTLGLM